MKKYLEEYYDLRGKVGLSHEEAMSCLKAKVEESKNKEKLKEENKQK